MEKNEGAVRLAAVGGLPRCKGTTDTNRFNVTRAACIGGALHHGSRRAAHADHRTAFNGCDVNGQ